MITAEQLAQDLAAVRLKREDLLAALNANIGEERCIARYMAALQEKPATKRKCEIARGANDSGEAHR